jgi:hypothetical protein
VLIIPSSWGSQLDGEKLSTPRRIKSPTWEQQWINHMTFQGISPPEAAASPEAYTNYASLSLKQRKRIITQTMKRSTCKSTNKGAMAKRRRRKFTYPPESGG